MYRKKKYLASNMWQKYYYPMAGLNDADLTLCLLNATFSNILTVCLNDDENHRPDAGHLQILLYNILNTLHHSQEFISSQIL